MKLHLIALSLLITVAWSTEESYGDNYGSGKESYGETPGSMLLRLNIETQDACYPTPGPNCCYSPFFGKGFYACFDGDLYYLNGNLYGKRIGMSSAYCDLSFPGGSSPMDGDKNFFLSCKQTFQTYWGKWAMNVEYEVCNVIDLDFSGGGHLLLSASDGSIDPYLTVRNSTLLPMMASKKFDCLDNANIVHGTGKATGIKKELPITNPLDLSGLDFFDEHEDNLYYTLKLHFKDERHYKCQGYCGYKTPDGCWCDEQCFAYGDCCYDACASCYESCYLDDDINEFAERPPNFEANGRGIHYSVYAAVAGGTAIVGMGAIFCFKRRRQAQWQ